MQHNPKFKLFKRNNNNSKNNLIPNLNYLNITIVIRNIEEKIRI